MGRCHALTSPAANRTTPTAAVERVPEIKPEDVEEVFFGNVLSAK
jgi:acetyl-CoA C-acetyltransferase